MAYWLVKSEPEDWSWQDQKSVECEPWTGVRNHQAQKNMRAMALGDQVLFYHSGKKREIVGLCSVVKAAYPDPTDHNGKWCLIDLKAEQDFMTPVPLKTIKMSGNFDDLALVKQPRLSVMPVPDTAFQKLCKMGGL